MEIAQLSKVYILAYGGFDDLRFKLKKYIISRIIFALKIVQLL